MKSQTMKVFFIVLGGVIAVGLVGGGIFLLREGRSIAGLSIDFSAPDQVLAGEPFSLEVQIGNSSDHVLEDVSLIIELPSGMAFVGSSEEKTVVTKALGDVGVGSLTRETFELIALGGGNTVMSVTASVTYRTASLQTEFEKKASKNIFVEGENVSFDLSIPEKVFSGETFMAKLAYKNTGTVDLESLELELELPPAYTFVSAIPAPDAGNTLWQLGDLHTGSEGVIEIKGSLTGSDNAFFEVRAALTAEFGGRSYTIAEKTGSIIIQPSPLSLSLTVNNAQNIIAHPDEALTYTLRFSNDTDIGFKDVIARARIVGEMFDIPTVSSNASLRAVDNTLIWNAANTPGLDTLNPGETRTVTFTIRLKKQYPIKKLGDKNYTLKVFGEVESPTTPYFVEAKKTLTMANLETKVGGSIVMGTKGLFRDATSGILNKGPWPMKAGQSTQFTIHWLIVNYATDVSNVSLKAFLGGNVKLVGTPKSNIASVPVYNENTQEIRWDIPDIVATKGIVGAPVEAIFQVEALPSVANVGKEMTLIGKTILQATDDFTGESLTAEDFEVVTNKLDDPTVTPAEGFVIQ